MGATYVGGYIAGRQLHKSHLVQFLIIDHTIR
jgi:hypothetical protein